MTAAGMATQAVSINALRSVCIDRAYSEYCRLVSDGGAVDLTRFCAAYSGISVSLRQAILDHHWLEDRIRLLPPWPQPGENIAGFIIEELLGRGGFARVYLAREIAVGNRPVVVKVMSGCGDEAAILGAQRHPGIVPVHSIRSIAGRSILCMPYLGRATLAHVLNGMSGRPPALGTAFDEAIAENSGDEPLASRFDRMSFVDAAVTVMGDVVNALEALHACRVCHRDLKPSNILLGFDGRARILDFNLAVDSERTAIRHGGTIPYMAPELVRGMLSETSAPAAENLFAGDVYAVGVMMFELLGGHHPWPPREVGSDLCRRQLAAQHADLPSLRLLNPHVDAELEALVHRCLSVSPSGRPTATEICQSIAAYRDRVAARWRRGRRAFVIAAAAVSVAGAASMYIGNSAGAARRRVNSALAAKDWPATLTAVDNYLARNSSDANGLLVRGVSLAHLNRWAEAADALAVADPDETNRLALTWRGYVLLRDSNKRLAGHVLTQSIARGASGAEEWNNLGLASQTDSRFDTARAAFDRAVDIRGDEPAIRFNRMRLALKLIQRGQRQFDAVCADDARHVLASRVAPGQAIFWATDALANVAKFSSLVTTDEVAQAFAVALAAGIPAEDLHNSLAIRELLHERRIPQTPAGGPSRIANLGEWSILRPALLPDPL